MRRKQSSPENCVHLAGEKTSSSQPFPGRCPGQGFPWSTPWHCWHLASPEPCLIPGKCTVQGADWEAASQQLLFIPGLWSALSEVSFQGREAQGHSGSCLTWELTGHSTQGDQGWLQGHRAFFQKHQAICCVSLLWVLEPPQRVLDNKVLGITLQGVIKGCDFSFLPHLVQHNGGEDLGDTGNSVGEETFGEIQQ